MQSYQELSSKIAVDSSIAVIVLLNPDATDSEFWPLRPQPLEPSELNAPDDFAARKLRIVGVVGLCGLKPQCAFKEELPERVMGKIGVAFVEYVRVALGQSYNEQLAVEVARQMPGDFLEFAGRLYALPDGRAN